MKQLFGLLLLMSLAFFMFMQWAEKDAGDGKAMQPQAEINADKIRLVKASAPVAAQSAVPAPASAVALSAAKAAAPVCMEWGEFSGSDLKRATDALAVFKLGNALSQREVEHTIGYWVYLPPLKNKAEADSKIAQLKDMGVNDYFAIQDEGKWHNAISLGLFKTQEAARKFLASMEAKGVKSAKIGPRTGKLTSTIFLLKEPDAAVTAKMTLLQKDFPDSELKAAACAAP